MRPGSETWSDQSLYCTGAAIGAPPDPIGPGGPGVGHSAAGSAAIAAHGLRAVRGAGARQHARLRRAASRSRDGAVPPVVGATRLQVRRRRLRALSTRGPAGRGGAREPSQRVPGGGRGSRRGARTRSGARCRSSACITTRWCCSSRRAASSSHPPSYTRHALAAVTTHDLPTLHGWWSGHDIDLWEKLGFYAEPSIGERSSRRTPARTRAPAARAASRETLGRRSEGVVPEYSAELGRAVHVYLGKSPTALVTVQLEDMIGMLDPVNVPGTSSEYSNWTRRMTSSAREIFARTTFARCAPPWSRAGAGMVRWRRHERPAAIPHLHRPARGRRHHGGLRHGLFRARQGGCFAGHRRRRSRGKNHPRGSGGDRAGRARGRGRGRGRGTRAGDRRSLLPRRSARRHARVRELVATNSP